MKILTIGGNEYKVEFSFEAAEHKECVDKMFKIVSGGYLMKSGPTGDGDKISMAATFIDGTADMVSDIPRIAISSLYAGLLENNPVKNEQEAKALFKQFVKENPDDERASFFGMYNFLKDCMEEDGFFKLTGLDKLVEKMNQEAEKTQAQAESVKTPQDHKRKAASTK